MSYVIAFATSFLFIFLKAYQQQNVIAKEYAWVLPTSMSMAACEVYVVATTARNGYGWIVLAIGLGSGLGCMASMYIHGRMSRGREANEP